MTDTLIKESKYMKIKQLLSVKKMTYEEFSLMIGVSRPTIVNWFKGKSKIDIDLIEVIAEKLEVPITYFFSEQDVKKMPSSFSGEKENLLRELINEKDERIKLLEEKIKLLEELKKTNIPHSKNAGNADTIEN